MSQPSTTTQNVTPPREPFNLPDHTQLPDSDDDFVKNFQEHPQSIILTTSIEPLLKKIHPNGDYCIGQDSGIYWRFTEPPEKGVEAPDWFYVPGVPSRLNGQLRRSYVLWKEKVPPFIVIEFASKNGKEEKDSSPPPEGDEIDPETGKPKKAGKFWVYEQAVKIPYYAIFNGFKGTLEVYHLERKRYKEIKANRRGHYAIPEMGIELGILYDNQKPPTPWLRWWDNKGNLLLTGNELAEQAEVIAIRERLAREQAETIASQERLAKERAETIAYQERLAKERAETIAYQERLAKEQERQQKEKLAAYLRSLGIDPEKI
ncbi:Uma2 family endonuclease [Cylindrospermopsis curvispora]|uniref:Uma2 family endonuclease n=1 Tax=Cylindrospermopsis curvispora GIHE-G1 TaxID=2666332 RepID=A0A7H0F007_9CYAN|nr:Uma2 family endonuclease [Cylindrospermopsis curvispora]QNP29373.1 Uma2 family endonuclease [Cylindrospermopsis curvispora GIHE-G1]